MVLYHFDFNVVGHFFCLFLPADSESPARSDMIRSPAFLFSSDAKCNCSRVERAEEAADMVLPCASPTRWHSAEGPNTVGNQSTGLCT